MDITFALGAEIQSDPLDVVLVADLSGSMTYQDVKSSNGAVISRLQALKNTLQGENGRRGLIDTILSNSNNRLSIVGFAGKIDNLRYDNYYQWPAWAGYFSGISPHDDAKTVLNWSNDIQGAKSMVSRMSVDNSGDSIGYERGIGTGTNIGAGLQSATELLQSARTSAKKVVIFLSDGFANMYYDIRGYTIYNWSNNDGVTEIAPSWYQTNLNTFTETVSGYLAPKIDGFYSIKFRYSNSTDSISKLKEYIGSYNSSIPNEILSANNERELREQFKEITKKILPLGVHHVTIKDVLSKYVQLLPNNSSNIRVVKIENDKQETLGSDKVTLETRKNENGLVEVAAKFNPNYILDDSVKYALKFIVTSSQEALDAIAGDKKLEAGDAEGSDVNKLYSNKGASVTYSYGIGTTQTKTKEYTDNPTFKPSDPLTVPVEVKWEGVNGSSKVTANQPKALGFKLIQKSKSGGTDKNEYRKTSVGAKAGELSETSNFEKVAKGYQYDLTAPDVPGFTKEVKKEGTDQSPTFKVFYRQLPSLTIRKILVPEDTSNKSFNINIELTNKERNPINGTFGDIKVTNGHAQIPLTHNAEKSLKYLPYGTHYKVEEEAASTNGYHVTYENQEGDLNKDETSTVTNHKLPSLSVTKKVTGVFANLLKSFKITINIRDAQNSPLNGTYNATVNNKRTPLQFTNGRASIDLNKDQTIKIDGLPLGSHFTIEEEASSSRDYQVSYENKEGTLDSDKAATVTNNKNSVPETGIDFLSSTLMLRSREIGRASCRERV